MQEFSLRFRGAIFFSFLLALVLTLLPMGELLKLWRPEWIALTIIHWVIVAPNHIRLWVVVVFGLLVDVIYGSLLGQHILGFVIVYFIVVLIRWNIQINEILHQLFLVIIATGGYLLINLWVLGLTNNSPNSWHYWSLLLASIVCWPIYHYLLTFFHSKNKIYR